jgi:hypothetical protein
MVREGDEIEIVNFVGGGAAAPADPKNPGQHEGFEPGSSRHRARVPGRTFPAAAVRHRQQSGGRPDGGRRGTRYDRLT